MLKLSGPDLPEGRHDLGAFVGELARSVLFSVLVATPWALLELAARLWAKLR